MNLKLSGKPGAVQSEASLGFGQGELAPTFATPGAGGGQARPALKEFQRSYGENGLQISVRALNMSVKVRAPILRGMALSLENAISVGTD